jgi:hypothetical protein
MADEPASATASAPPRRRIPRWLKVLYTLFVLVLVPVYTLEYGLGNFLWFSNVALLTTVAALWLESRMLAGMMLLATLIPEAGWMVDFFTRLLTGYHLFGLTAYMWDVQIPLFVRVLSMYHIPLPLLLLWLVWRLGYARRALLYQTGLAWLVLLATYALTDPDRNVNYAFGFPEPGDVLPQPWHLLAVMVVLPVAIYLPTHVVLRFVMARR